MVFSNEFLWYLNKSTNRGYLTEADIQKTLNYCAKYKIKSSTCTQVTHTHKNKHKIANILDRNCPLKTLEIVFESIEISKFSGDGYSHILQLNPTLFYFINKFCIQYEVIYSCDYWLSMWAHVHVMLYYYDIKLKIYFPTCAS